MRQIQGRGQTLAVAKPVKAGDTSVEVSHLVFDGEIDHDNVTSRPFLTEMRGIVPSMRHLSPQAPAVDLVYAKPYLAHGLPPRALDAKPVPGTPNAGELILALKSPPAAVDFTKGSDRSGGFVAPNLSVEGISRALGAIGESGNAPTAFDAGKFDPASFLSGAMPKLFGLFSLLELLDDAGFDEAPAFVSDALEPVTKLLTEAQRLRERSTTRRRARRRRSPRRPTTAPRPSPSTPRTSSMPASADLEPHLDALIAALPGLPGHCRRRQRRGRHARGRAAAAARRPRCARPSRPPCAPRWRSRYRR